MRKFDPEKDIIQILYRELGVSFCLYTAFHLDTDSHEEMEQMNNSDFEMKIKNLVALFVPLVNQTMMEDKYFKCYVLRFIV